MTDAPDATSREWRIIRDVGASTGPRLGKVERLRRLRGALAEIARLIADVEEGK